MFNPTNIGVQFLSGNRVYVKHLTNVQGVEAILTRDKEPFKVKVDNLPYGRCGIALYVDGFATIQNQSGYNSLPTYNVDNYSTHNGNIMVASNSTTLNSFVTLNGVNNLFVFTHDVNQAIATQIGNAFNVPTNNRHRIDLFIWRENINQVQTRGGITEKGSFVGAGGASGNSFGTTNDLVNPTLIYKVTFVHVPYSPSLNKLQFTDENNNLIDANRILGGFNFDPVR